MASGCAWTAEWVHKREWSFGVTSAVFVLSMVPCSLCLYIVQLPEMEHVYMNTSHSLAVHRSLMSFVLYANPHASKK